MKVTKVTLFVVDFDELGEDSIKDVFENTSYPNHCMFPRVLSMDTRDIGEWDDDNPLNSRETSKQEIKRLFDDK